MEIDGSAAYTLAVLAPLRLFRRSTLLGGASLGIALTGLTSLGHALVGIPPTLAAAPSPGSASASTCPAPYASASFHPGWNRGLRVGNEDRSVYVIAPRDEQARPPLFVAFNGTSEDGESFAARAHLQDFADRGFLVLAPSSAGHGQFWPVWDAMRARGQESGPNADLDLFDTLLACVDTRVDTSRVYIGGHSAGGIFTNYVLQRRSEQIAGAIVASGIYSQTSPDPAVPLAATTVLVTIGGSNDRWSGRAGNTAVRNFSFPSEAAIASHAYSASPDVGVATCRGSELGHAWLDDANSWMIDVLLAHPKGGPRLDYLPDLPESARADCSLGAWDDSPVVGLTCPASAVPGCAEACQQVADGAWSNPTVGPVLHHELVNLGFSDGGCAGCVERCESLVSTPADTAVLACMSAQPAVQPGARGIAGATPLIDAVNTCCAGKDDSRWCVEVCGELHHNLAARAYFTACRR